MTRILPAAEGAHQFEAHIAHLSLVANRQGAVETERRRLITALGCAPHTPALRTQHTSAADVEGISPPERVAIRIAGLASACDAYAQVGTWSAERSYGLLLLMQELVKNDNWLRCLQAPHSAHALACNLMRTAHHGSVSINTRAAMFKVLNDWVALSGTPPARRFSYSDADDTNHFDQRVVRALFGDYWWAFNAPDAKNSFDYDLIMTGVPDFLPGLLPDSSGGPLALPDFLDHP